MQANGIDIVLHALDRCIEPAAKKSAISVIHRLLNDAGNRRQFARDKGLDRLSPWLMPYLGVPKLAGEATGILVLIAKTSGAQHAAVKALDLPPDVRAKVEAVQPGFVATGPTRAAKSVDFMGILGGAAAARRSSKPTTEQLLGDFARQADDSRATTGARASYAAPRSTPVHTGANNARPTAKTTDNVAVQRRPGAGMQRANAPFKAATLHTNAAKSSASAAAAVTAAKPSPAVTNTASTATASKPEPKVGGAAFTSLVKKPRNNTMALLKKLEEEAAAEVCHFFDFFHSFLTHYLIQ